jgi:phenylalanyl-tRNA synthetase alpha chain
MINSQISEIKSEISEKISSFDSSKSLYEFRKIFLDNKEGKISQLMKGMRDVAPEDRPQMGKVINEVKVWAISIFDEYDAKIKALEIERKNKSEAVDVTMPGVKNNVGGLHPNTLVTNQLIDLFSGMGFEIYSGHEIENDYYNFTALNTPKDHPARDMQDTFYVSENFLLRTQTSGAQIHVMENKKPPIKILSPGKVFRSDDDATHSPMFSQMEGLVVDKGISISDLQGMLDVFSKTMFGENVKTRLRPSYFPFTEPSVEVDVSCFECGGKGCRLCKGTGWIEILGAGMVNHHVLENCGIDSTVYSGFAFGMGIERIAMLKYGINNIRALFESDVRFAKQFKD